MALVGDVERVPHRDRCRVDAVAHVDLPEQIHLPAELEDADVAVLVADVHLPVCDQRLVVDRIRLW